MKTNFVLPLFREAASPKKKKKVLCFLVYTMIDNKLFVYQNHHT